MKEKAHSPVTVLVHGDRVVSDAGLHEGCLRIARAFCPAVSAGAFTTVQVRAEDLLADGATYRPGVRLPERCQWRVRARIANLALGEL